jgi:monoterpene epsilon-lactone hydrolase
MQRHRVPTLLKVAIVVVSIALLPGHDVSYASLQAQCASGPGQTGFVFVPDTVSPEWQERLQRFPDPSCRPAWPAPDDVQGWRTLQQAQEAARMPAADAALARYQPTIEATEIGGVPVLDVRPREWRDDGKVLVYAHGGGYVFFSSRSALNAIAPLADLTGLRVVSVDYTLAPVGKWDHVTDQVAAVLRGLTNAGYRPQDIAIYGDSAGGALAAGAVLKLRDRGLAMPAAVVTWSPAADITDRGDTHATLKHADPTVVHEKYGRNASAAYADPSEQRNPYVSPVYADFSGGFPPTLIQGGTKEVLLSSFVRLYRALDMAGVPVTLDLYEGMPHVFQHVLPDGPESRIALDKTRKFLDTHLGR